MKHKRALRGRRWQRVREAILERDGRRCSRCGRAGRLEVHHIKPLAEGGAPYDGRNLEARCFRCHQAAHRARRPADVAAWERLLDGSG